MERREHVLLDRLDRNRPDRFVAYRLQQALRIGAVGLVAQHVGTHRVRRQEHDAVAAGAGLAAPEVRGPAGLHYERRRLALGEEPRELRSREPLALCHLPRPPR